MSVWFDGQGEIDCSIEQVKAAVENHGELFLEIVSLMPGLTTVELVTQGTDSVTITTNEGLMKRTSISKRIEADRVVMEYDETYEAGSKVTATSHFTDEFTASDTGVTHHLVMSDVEASGFLGFFYQKFGASKTGNAFLAVYKEYLERSD